MSDLIDRKETIRAIDSLGEDYISYYKLIMLICRLPSAEPERKKGKWMWKLADNGWADHICSECGWTKNTDIHVRLGYKYCPNCGADMRGNDERMDQSWGQIARTSAKIFGNDKDS